MAFTPEHKVRWENLAPSLQEKFKQVARDVVRDAINDPSSAIYKAIENMIVNQILNGNSEINKNLQNMINALIKDPNGSISKAIDDKIANALKPNPDGTLSSIYKSLQDFISKTINDAISGKDKSSTLYRTIRGLIFTNLPPKVGFLDQTKVPIFGTYNMSNSRGHGFCFTDSEGRETIFKRCSNTPYTPLELSGVFRATRMKSDEEFIWENTPIVPKFVKEMPGYVANEKGPLFDNIRVTEVYGLTSEFIILEVYFKAEDKYRNYLVMNKCSGSYSSWKEYYELPESIFKRVYHKKGCMFSLCRIKTKSNTFYMHFDTDWYDNDGQVPCNGSTVTAHDVLNNSVNNIRNISDESRTKNLMVLKIYKVTEDATNHRVNMNLVRTDKILRCGIDAICSSGYSDLYKEFPITYPYNEWSNQIIYIKEKNCLFMSPTVFVGYEEYSNDPTTLVRTKYTWQGFVYKFCSIYYLNINIDQLLGDSNTNYFENRDNWSRYPQDMIRNMKLIYQTGFSTLFVYDSLKRRLVSFEFSYEERTKYIGTDLSSFRIGFFNINNDSDWDKYRSEFDASNISKDQYYINGKVSQVRSYLQPFTVSDAFALGKAINYGYIDNDVVIMKVSSQKYGETMMLADIEPLKNPLTGSNYNSIYSGIKLRHWNLRNENIEDRYKCRVRNGDHMDSYDVGFDLGADGQIYVYKEKKFNNTFNNGLTKTINVLNKDNDYEINEFGGKKILPILRSIWGRSNNLNMIGLYYDPYRNRYIFVYNLYSDIHYSGNIGTLVNNDNSIYMNFLVINSDGSYRNYNMMDMSITYTADSSFNIKNSVVNSIRDLPLQLRVTRTGYFTREIEYRSKKSLFLDNDGSFVVTNFQNSVASGVYNQYFLWHVNLEKSQIIVSRCFNPWSCYQIGYSNSYGYYFTVCDENSILMSILSSKDVYNGNTIQGVGSLEDLFKNLNINNFLTYYTLENIARYDGKAFIKVIPCISVSGKIAYLNRTALYLGGYFSYIDSQEVILNEGDNYIYITRDSNSFELSVDVYDHLIGIPGQSQFNRILISYMKVLNESIVYQNDYDIDYYNIR